MSRSVVNEGQGVPKKVPHSRLEGGVLLGMQPVRPRFPSTSISTNLRRETHGAATPP
jgi:hypothetical protein